MAKRKAPNLKRHPPIVEQDGNIKRIRTGILVREIDESPPEPATTPEAMFAAFAGDDIAKRMKAGMSGTDALFDAVRERLTTFLVGCAKKGRWKVWKQGQNIDGFDLVTVGDKRYRVPRETIEQHPSIRDAELALGSLPFLKNKTPEQALQLAYWIGRHEERCFWRQGEFLARIALNYIGKSKGGVKPDGGRKPTPEEERQQEAEEYASIVQGYLLRAERSGEKPPKWMELTGAIASDHERSGEHVRGLLKTIGITAKTYKKK